MHKFMRGSLIAELVSGEAQQHQSKSIDSETSAALCIESSSFPGLLRIGSWDNVLKYW